MMLLGTGPEYGKKLHRSAGPGKDQTMDQQQRDAIAAQIRTNREMRGWSPEKLAEVAGLSDKTVRSMESGNNVRPGSLAKALAALDIEPAAEVAERRTEPADVHIVMEVMKIWLTRMPEDGRPQAVYDLMQYLMHGR